MNSVVYLYQLRQFFRNRTLLMALLVLLASGIYSAFYGKHFVAEQERGLYALDTLEQGNIKRFQEYVSKLPDSRKAGNENYLGDPVIKYAPGPFTALAIGQKDTYPFYHKVNSMQSIYQQSNTKIQNPVKLLAGNFDLSFVIVYLIPLFIIVLGYNVLSEERELHTATLIDVQSDLKRMVTHKLIFRMLLIIGITLLINLFGFLVNGIAIVEFPMMFSWMLISIVYIAFWFSVVYLVIAFDRQGSVNALLLGGLWVLLLLVVPTIVNRQVVERHEKEQVQMMFDSRGDTQNPYELSDVELRDSFSRIVHKYALPDTSDTSKTGLIRLRSLMVGLIRNQTQNSIGSSALQSTHQEYKKALNYNLINPGFAIQNAFNQIAGSEISNFWAHMKAVEDFETERLYFLNRYYIKTKDFNIKEDPQPSFQFRQATVGPLTAAAMIWPVGLVSILFMLMARRIFR